jgi:hypothetical protein
MKRILFGLCALSLCTGVLSPKASAQTVVITTGPEVEESGWVWSDEYQCWIWNGPEFQGEYEGHPYSYWHTRHEGDRREVRHVPHHPRVEEKRVEERKSPVDGSPKVEEKRIEERRERPKVEEREHPRVEKKVEEKTETKVEQH